MPNLDILQPTSPTRDSGANNWSEGCVSRSTPDVPVRAADMTINAPNVVVDMQQHPVILPQTFLNQPEIELSQLHHIINSPPVTPVKVSTLSPLLQQYDPRLKQFLIDGFSFGFRVGFVGTSRLRLASNLHSAKEQPKILAAKLEKELCAGRIVGPFSRPPFDNFISSPLGVVPKKTPGEFRLIHHLSYPDGSSVNDFIPDQFSSVQYASIGDAITLIKSLGRACYMAKTDIKSAFRIIPIHPDDYHLLGMTWNNSYFFDRCLPMGCSCAIFEAFSTALESLSGVLHILDDFLFIATSQGKCDSDLNNFLGLCDRLGVPIAHEKTEGPSTTLQFAGITLDTINMEAQGACKMPKRVSCRKGYRRINYAIIQHACHRISFENHEHFVVVTFGL